MELNVEQIAQATGGRIKAKKWEMFEGISTDSRRIAPRQLFVPLKGPNFDGHDFIESALKSGARGFLFQQERMTDKEVWRLAEEHNASAIAVEDTLYALGELAKWVRLCFRYIRLSAITGSAGKSTTKEMTASILSLKGNVLKNEGNLNNRIGLPLTLFNLNDDINYAVVELGTNEPGEIVRLAQICLPDVACVTNVGPVHLEGLGSVEGVAMEKGALARALSEDGIFVANADNSFTVDMARNTKAKVFAYGLSKKPDFNHEIFVRASDVHADLSGSAFTLKLGKKDISMRLHIAGIHNVMNALASATIAFAMGANEEEIVKGLREYKPLKWRAQIHKLPNEITVIEDCYNSNPLGARAALEMLAQAKGRKIAVLGDMLELGEASLMEHYKLGEEGALKGIDVLIAVGSFAEEVIRGFKEKGGVEASAVVASSAREATEKLLGLMKKGDTVLIKASRGVHLEEVFPILRDNLGIAGEEK